MKYDLKESIANKMATMNEEALDGVLRRTFQNVKMASYLSYTTSFSR